MSINNNEFDTLLKISRLDIKDAEKGKVLNGISALINFIDDIKDIDTSNTYPLINLISDENCFEINNIVNEIDQQKVKNPAQSSTYIDNNLFKTPVKIVGD